MAAEPYFASTTTVKGEPRLHFEVTDQPVVYPPERQPQVSWAKRLDRVVQDMDVHQQPADVLGWSKPFWTASAPELRLSDVTVEQEAEYLNEGTGQIPLRAYSRSYDSG